MNRLFKKTKKSFLKAAVACLALALAALCLFAGCASGQKAALTLEYEGGTKTISSDIYGYYLSYIKTRLLYNYYYDMYSAYGASMPEDVSTLTDIPELWSEIYVAPYTYGAIVKRQAEAALKQMLAVYAYCGENGLELSKGELDKIDSAVEDMVAAYYQDSKSRLNSKLKNFGINEKTYKEIKKYEAMEGLFEADLFDPDSGKQKITDAMINQLYGALCSRVKHILILFSPGTYDKDGLPESYSAEELAAREAKVEDIYDRIVAGEDFDSFLSESEDPGTSAYPDGYTIGEDTGFMAEFVEAAFDMEIGEVRKVMTSYGMHIMKRFELLPAAEALDPDSGQSWKNLVGSQLQSYLIDNALSAYVEKIETNADETKTFNVSKLPIMFDCLELW